MPDAIPPLSEFLGAGGDPTMCVRPDTLAGWLTNLPWLPPREAERARGRLHPEAAGYGDRLHDAGLCVDGWGAIPDLDAREYLLQQWWGPEIASDPDLRVRLVDYLPDPLASEVRREIDENRRFHAISVELPSRWWSCHNCAAAFDEGEQQAFVVKPPAWKAKTGDEIRYCAGCIAIAHHVLDSARDSNHPTQ